MAHHYRLPIRSVAFAAALAATAAFAGPSDLRVYIPTGESAEVLVIDAATSSVTGRIAGLPAAHGLAVTPDGARLVVGSYDERPAGAALPEKPAGISAADHAAHHTPKPAAAVAPSISTVSIVDTRTNSILRRVDVPGAVHHVAISPDGRVAAVTHPTADAVTVIDLDEMSVITTVPTGTMPNYATFSSDGGTLYVSNSGEDTIAVVDRSTWSVARLIAADSSPEHLVLSPDGERLFVNNVAEGSVSVIDLSEARVVETLRFGADLHGIDISDDGSTLFVAVRGDDKVMSIVLKDGARRSAALTPAPYHLSNIRGAGVLYVSSAEDPVVWILDAATLATKGMVAISGIGHQFAQSSGN